MNDFHRVTMWIVAASLAACTKASPPESEGEPDEPRKDEPDRLSVNPEALETLRLTYAKAEVRDVEPSLEVPAEIVPVPDRRATVGPRAAGRVVEVPANVGDAVAKGTTLVVLESEEVGRARADLIAARARRDVATRALTRQRQLLQDEITSRRAVEETEAALVIAEADMSAALTRLATFGAEAKAEGADEPGNPARVRLASPIAGTVVARSVHVGQWVQPADTVVDIVDLDQLWVQASVYERELRFVRVGQAVQIEVRAFPGEVFAGKVAQIDGTLDERTRSVGVRVVLPNPGHRLRPGMFATARVQGAHDHEPRHLLAIPWAAVQEVDGHRAVFVKVGEGTFELRRIHTGDRAGDSVEVLNGLAAGDEVVADGSFLLKGQLLRATLGEEE
ncbi:MAG: efflux RND transporter periplasmic adaptor subunit [Deltaproteobacteria bacterium]|nr:efflux RND transporter periplasmic adaptor subunit [Deltaproteobacteria bacterium]